MIKRITFAAPEVKAGGAGPAAWRDAVARDRDAPTDVRPARVTVCAAVPDVIGDPAHPGVRLEWFRDTDHLERYESWRASAGSTDPDLFVVAEEHVRRGGDWLARRWRDGGPRWKHIALATRAGGLSAPEFLARWRDHAGRVGPAPIPEAARGQAYVQNHPLPRADGEWVYDAVTEVWFDTLEDLRARVDWFAQPGRVGADRDLFRASWFVAAREEVLADGCAPGGL